MMIRKTFVTFAAALLAVMLLGTNDARAFLIDGFGDAQTLLDAESELGAVSCPTCDLTANTLTTLTDTDLVDTVATIDEVTRTIDGSVTSTAGFNLSAPRNFVFGADQGELVFTTGTQVSAIGTVKWNDFDAFSVDNTTIVIDVISNDQGAGDLTIELTDGGGNVAEVTFLFVATGAQTINLTSAMFLADNGSIDLTDIIMVLMTVDGSQSADLDLSLDMIETAIPEPATLALFGIGLLGLGVLSRRRRKRLVA